MVEGEFPHISVQGYIIIPKGEHLSIELKVGILIVVLFRVLFLSPKGFLKQQTTDWIINMGKYQWISRDPPLAHTAMYHKPPTVILGTHTPHRQITLASTGIIGFTLVLCYFPSPFIHKTHLVHHNYTTYTNT